MGGALSLGQVVASDTYQFHYRISGEESWCSDIYPQEIGQDKRALEWGEGLRSLFSGKQRQVVFANSNGCWTVYKRGFTIADIAELPSRFGLPTEVKDILPGVVGRATLCIQREKILPRALLSR